ncbi:MAG TPA: terpene synthase family protein [Streptosporangiaceae bacterium]|nr:terpene synthase family protein [Streptosporangiaceae bacterium]
MSEREARGALAADVRRAPAARECGAICAVAGRGQREMRAWAARYPALLDAEAFDPALFGTLAAAAAFSGPGLTAADLRVANHLCLWCFAVDWRIDYVATSEHEVADIVRRCAAVADGGAPDPGDDLTRALADFRDELAAAPAFARLSAFWRDELGLMLEAMAREWSWKAARDAGAIDRPTFEEYLANAHNLGFSVVFAAHWIATGPGEEGADDLVRAASHEVQRVIRLLNDLGTYERDLAWGDLNALMLDVARDGVDRRLAELTARARERLHALRDRHPGLAGHADYMERQMDFCAGFYAVGDFWGDLAEAAR